MNPDKEYRLGNMMYYVWYTLTMQETFCVEAPVLVQSKGRKVLRKPAKRFNRLNRNRY